jgi:hypothetical protein
MAAILIDPADRAAAERRPGVEAVPKGDLA